MSQQSVGIILGGIVPAVLLGIFAVFQKKSTLEGLGPGLILVVIGVCAILVGLVFAFGFKELNLPPKGVAFAALSGLFWSVATGLILIAISRLKAPISSLVPLFNMNTLVAVVLSLVVFSEWKSVNSPKLLFAAVLIIVGGVLASTS
jgi:glucose uptake protein GlcU